MVCAGDSGETGVGMKKWLKRLALLAVCVIAMLVAISAGSYYMLKREPEWYRRPPMTVQAREEAAARAQTQFSRIEELATSLRAYEARRQKAIREGTTLPADEMPKPLTVRLTEDELNAVLQQFASVRGWDESLKQYMSDPTIVLQKDRLILGGKLNELHVVASAYFSTTIDDKGMLKLDLVRVLGGNLPLPDVIFKKYRENVTESLSRNLPMLQRQAKIDRQGVPNDSTVQASLTLMLLQSIQHQPSEPVFFLPLLTAKGTVPVRLTEMVVEEGHIQMTIAPMGQAERKEMLERLRTPYSSPKPATP